MMKIADNTVKSVGDYFHLQLDELWGSREVHLFYEEVFYHLKSWNRMEVRLNADERLSESELVRVIHIVKELKLKRPLQYILGSAPFLNFELVVNEHTLIPRPETEELVQLVVEHYNSSNVIVDVGTGSGCIALGIKSQLKNVDVIGIDVSDEALKVAKINSDKYHLPITLINMNILEDVALLPPTKCIVSNPPYIPDSDAVSMENHVLDYEPHLALFTPGNDDLIFYKALAKYAKYNSAELFVEIHKDRGRAVQEVFHNLGASKSFVKKDLSGRDRMVHATW